MASVSKSVCLEGAKSSASVSMDSRDFAVNRMSMTVAEILVRNQIFRISLRGALIFYVSTV